MNVLYLIGNGFDVNAGMKTRYSDFYDYYLNSNNDENPLISEVKKSINQYLNNKEFSKINWSDLEIAFGKYCENFNSKEDFDTVYKDLVLSLSKYLQTQEKAYLIPEKCKTIFINDLCSPFKYISEVDREYFNTYLNSFTSFLKVNIITYNYTNSIENILQWKGSSLYVGTKLNHGQVQIDNIQHIHGYTNKRMVLGVNDESQVNNSELLKNQYFKNAIIKKDCNNAQKTLHVKICKNLILEANIICMFGLSLGETDKDWWSFIIENIEKKNIKLIIFAHSEQEVNGIFSYEQAEISDKIIYRFLSMSNLNNDAKERVRKNIYVAINANIFNFKFDKIRKLDNLKNEFRKLAKDQTITKNEVKFAR